MKNSIKSSIKVDGVNIVPDSIKFSGGEVQAVFEDDYLSVKEHAVIEADIRCSDGLMLLLQVSDVLDRFVDKKVLVMPYLPYARQDHTNDRQECLSLKVFCKLINDCKFDSVSIFDCHSPVGLALLDRVRHIDQTSLLSVKIGLKMKEYDAIIAPDSGSMKKAAEIGKVYGLPVVNCEKMRNPKTQELTKSEVDLSELVMYTNVLIVDDICDGSRTFIALAEKIHKVVPVVDLYVTHGIFSRGIEGLKNAGINDIYAYQDWTNNPEVK
jgi:ribose-phosphate pyrophosphokinase